MPHELNLTYPRPGLLKLVFDQPAPTKNWAQHVGLERERDAKAGN